MDRFWMIVRWGAISFSGIIFGIALIITLSGLSSILAAVTLSHLGIIACPAGMLGNIMLVSNAVSRRRQEMPPLKTIWVFFSWSGSAILAVIPGPHQVVLPWIFAVTLGSGILALQLKKALCFCVSLFFVFVGSAVWIYQQTDVIIYLVIMSIAIVTSWVIRFLYHELTSAREEMSQLRREVGYLTQTNVRLQNHVIQEKEFILVGERDRIAREFHDTLGHTLTGLVVKLQAIQSLIKIDPGRANQELESSCALVREALREARLVVSGLRDPDSKVLQGQALWATLCETFAKCTGITIRVDIESDLGEMDDITNAVVYRFIQEALTNAYRHGEATLIDVAVWWRKNDLRVRVSDNGHGVKNLQEGFGITGIRERVAELKGQVGWRSEYGKGFDIAVVIPCCRGEEVE